MTTRDKLLSLLLGVGFWAMFMALLFFAGNMATSKFIYVDF
jgi:hypothetical protein